ncbi:MAG: acylneuraminate cytidylyltransferase [Cyclobacteriaceae bacterium]
MGKVVAFIPARGGSKSIPGKNIKILNGQPLIYWVIQSLIQCESIDEVWVSTDSDEIKNSVNLLRLSSVHIFDRGVEFSSDTASTEDAMLEFIEARSLSNEILVLVQATSPFTESHHFEEALRMFDDKNVDSLLTATRTKRFYWDLNNDPVNYSFKSRPRRQDFEGMFIENGAFYINSCSNIISNKNRLSGTIGIYEMPEYTSLEIDEEMDWFLAEQLMIRHKLRPTFTRKQGIKLFVTDVDGVLTDSGMYYSENGDELKKFNTRDGMGFELLRKEGIKTAIVTSEDTRIVSNRATKLKVDYLFQGKMHSGKLDAIKKICEKEGIQLNEVAYIGDDINCKEALLGVGLSACPNDADSEIRDLSNVHVLPINGGCGVVRHFIDNYILGLT